MEKVTQDLVIIGAGVSGLSAAIYGARGGLSTTIIEMGAVGGQALQIDRLENYPGFSEPTDGYTLSASMQSQATTYGAKFIYSQVSSIAKEDNLFCVKHSDGELFAQAVIVATGATHRKIDVPGEKEFSGRGVSYCATCDGPFFKGKKILVVGGGDSACDEAQFLSKLSDKVTIIHRKERFRAQKVVANRVLNNPNIMVKFNTVVKEIKVSSVVLQNLTHNSIYEEEFDGVFIFVGMAPQTEFVSDLVKLDKTGYIITDKNMESSVSGLFACGDVRDSAFRQIVTASSDGAIAAHYAALYIDEQKNQKYC